MLISKNNKAIMHSHILSIKGGILYGRVMPFYHNKIVRMSWQICDWMVGKCIWSNYHEILSSVNLTQF